MSNTNGRMVLEWSKYGYIKKLEKLSEDLYETCECNNTVNYILVPCHDGTTVPWHDGTMARRCAKYASPREKQLW